MVKKNTKKKSSAPKKNDSNFLAFVTTFFSIIGFIVALLAWRDDKYVMHYAEQSLIVFVYLFVVNFIAGIFGWIPIIGWVIAFALVLSGLIFWIISWVYALSGEEKDVPFIGEFGRKFNLR